MRTFLKPWVAIVSASISAISWGLTGLDIWEKIPWSVIALISFIIFALVMFWKVYDLEQQLKRPTDEDAQRRRKKEDLELEELQAKKDRGYGGYDF